jgi:hypothetical protein
LADQAENPLFPGPQPPSRNPFNHNPLRNHIQKLAIFRRVHIRIEENKHIEPMSIKYLHSAAMIEKLLYVVAVQTKQVNNFAAI